MPYSSMTILPTNCKINKIPHTAFFCMMAYDTLDGSTHDDKTFNLCHIEDDAIRFYDDSMHESQNQENAMLHTERRRCNTSPPMILARLWLSLLCSWSLLSK